MNRIFLPALLVISAILAPASQAASPAAAPRMARVAAGGQVKLAPSARTPAQWTAERPRVRDLRPKIRGTFD